MAYYAHASLQWWRQHRRPLNFVVPTGNLGNALAAVWVREMGLPVGAIELACNANETLPDYFAGAAYTPRAAVATLANAMDVGAPSNFERLRWTFPYDADLRRQLSSHSVDDAAIRATVLRHAEPGEVFCPHTATAMHRLDLRADPADWAVVSTAHPAKFESVIEPLIGRSVPTPPALAAMLGRPAHAEALEASDEGLKAWLLEGATPQQARRLG
jgi:threonine synthase